MEKFIINKKAYLKNLLLTDTKIQVSDDNYETKEAFLKNALQEKKGLLDTKHDFLYIDITKVVPFKKEKGLQVFFLEQNKPKKIHLELTSEEEYNEVLSLIIKNASLQKSSEHKTHKSKWLKPAVYAFVALMFSFALYMNARDIENGKTITASGSRKGIKTLLINLSESLGASGSLILGTLISLSFIGYAILSYKKSKIEKEVYI